MHHTKIYNATEVQTPKGNIVIEGPVTKDRLTNYHFHDDLTAFRSPADQHKALLGIAALPEGRIIIARHNQTIIGYVTFVYPDPLERWAEGNNPHVLELGAIEVIPTYRKFAIGKSLLRISMMDNNMENYIIITTEYYWHWDLKGTQLSVWDYRKVMEKMMNAGGLEVMATDDPEISSHPANCLMGKLGDDVPQEAIESFNRLRFKHKYMY